MLSADDLESIRETAAEALPGLATIERPAATSDSAGGYTQVYSTIATLIPVRVNPIGALTAQEIERLQGVLGTHSDRVIALPFNTNIQPGDRITAVSDGYTTVSIVQAVVGPKSWWSVVRVVAASVS